MQQLLYARLFVTTAVARTAVRGASGIPPRLWVLPVVAGTAILVGFIIARSPPAGVALATAPLAVTTLWSAHARLIVAVFGGLIVFDSSSGFSYSKLLYLICLCLCLGAAWHSCVVTMQQDDAARVRVTVGKAWWLMVFIVSASLPVALLNDHSPTIWLRDVAPYLLLAGVPILAADTSQQVSARFLAGTFIAAGMLVTVALTLQLIMLRDLTGSATQQVALFTGFVFPVTLFCYASASVIHARRGHREVVAWGVIAGTIFSGLMLTGTRSGILLLVAPLAMLILGGGLKGARRGAALVAVCTGVVLLAYLVAGSAGIATETAQQRLLGTTSALMSPAEDGSLVDRFAQSGAAWELFKESPVLGVGPGHLFEWRTASGVLRHAFTVDASISTLAKLGVIGTLGLLTVFAMFAAVVRRVGSRREKAALTGLAAWGSIYVVIANPFEDKGLALGLLFVLALAFQHARETTPAAPRGVGETRKASRSAES